MTWKFWRRKTKTPPCPQIKDVQTPKTHEAAFDLAAKSDSESTPASTSLSVTVCPVKKEKCLKPAKRLSICEKCGACCAFFAVSFPETEMNYEENGAVLTATSLPFGHLRRVMRGTELSPPRCIALKGEIGMNVSCTIYAERPSTCRNFIRSWEKDTGNSLCDRARAVYGMQPFSKY